MNGRAFGDIANLHILRAIIFGRIDESDTPTGGKVLVLSRLVFEVASGNGLVGFVHGDVVCRRGIVSGDKAPAQRRPPRGKAINDDADEKSEGQERTNICGRSSQNIEKILSLSSGSSCRCNCLKSLGFLFASIDEFPIDGILQLRDIDCVIFSKRILQLFENSLSLRTCLLR